MNANRRGDSVDPSASGSSVPPKHSGPTFSGGSPGGCVTRNIGLPVTGASSGFSSAVLKASTTSCKEITALTLAFGRKTSETMWNEQTRYVAQFAWQRGVPKHLEQPSQITGTRRILSASSLQASLAQT